MAKYAATTSVSADASRLDIERLLKGHGITEFAVFSSTQGQIILFQRGSISYKLMMPAVDPDDRELTHDRRGKKRAQGTVETMMAQEHRRRWRALFLVLKAKMVAVQDEIVTFESEFLSYAVTNNGKTIGETLVPQLQSGGSPTLQQLALPGGNHG